MQRYGIAVLFGLFVLFASTSTYAHESLKDSKLAEKDIQKAAEDILTNLETRVVMIDDMLTVIRRKVTFIAFELPVNGNDDELNVYLHYLRSGFERKITEAKKTLWQLEADIQELKRLLEQEPGK